MSAHTIKFHVSLDDDPAEIAATFELPVLIERNRAGQIEAAIDGFLRIDGDYADLRDVITHVTAAMVATWSDSQEGRAALQAYRDSAAERRDDARANAAEMSAAAD